AEVLRPHRGLHTGSRPSYGEKPARQLPLHVLGKMRSANLLGCNAWPTGGIRRASGNVAPTTALSPHTDWIATCDSHERVRAMALAYVRPSRRVKELGISGRDAAAPGDSGAAP